MAGYLKDAWLEADPHAVALDGTAWYASHQAEIDRHIEVLCLGCGVIAADIPKDGSGYISSIYLIDTAVSYFYHRMFEAFSMVRDSQVDTYGALAGHYYHKYKNNIELLTRGRIL